jgi:serine/threonine-protein kinase
MGAVYAATHLRLEQRVAIKVMSYDMAANPEALERFRREAKVTSGLGHPHIVRVSDFSATPTGEPFLVMEFLAGEDLERRLRREGSLAAPEVVRIAKHVASALAATHAKGIVHRDLKPGNIFMVAIEGEPGFVKVLDFGISKVRSASTKLTRTSSIMGTPNYMSPEQAKGKIEDIDETTDQWALACIVWECLSGQGPFVGENVPSILFQIVHEAPPPLVPQVSGLPRQVEDVLRRALSKEKQDRFPSVTAFVSALEAALTGVPSVATAPTLSNQGALTQGKVVTGRATTFTRSAAEIDDGVGPVPTHRRWVWVAAAAGAMIVAVSAFLLFQSRREPPVSVSPTMTVPATVVAPPPQPEPKLEAPAPPPAPVAEAAPVVAAPEATNEKKDSVPKRARKRAAKGAAVSRPSPTPAKASNNEDRWRVD